MLAYPNRVYRHRDKVMALCESGVSSKCKHITTLFYRSYKFNVKRNGGEFKCKCCVHKEVYDKSTKEISGITKNVGINNTEVNDE